MQTHKLAASKIEVQNTIANPLLVGPARHGFMNIWTKLNNTDSWPSWLLGVDKVSAKAHTTMARGSIFEVTGIFGSGEIEILRWNPEKELILLLQMDCLRLAFSIHLSGNNDETIIDIEGEYELSGWKNVCWPFYRLSLSRQRRLMIRKLNFMLNQSSKVG